jgi:NADH:ubiquinone oxidoreductase subunit B-like Fe-S oxidoreductase
MTAARKPSAASIERALVEWHRAEANWRKNFGKAGSNVAMNRSVKAEFRLQRIAARLAGRRGK